MAQRSTRRGPENQKCLPRLERAIAGWTGSANSIQAGGRDEGRINRPDTRKHLNLRALPSETLLHPKGRPHTDIGAPAKSRHWFAAASYRQVYSL